MNRDHRIDLIEWLRGLAALAVAWFHLTNSYHDLVARSGAVGWVGVEVFFVISGFVIPLSLASDWRAQGIYAIRPFLLRRIVRIEPPYLVSVALAIALNILASYTPYFRGSAPTHSVGQVLAHVAYLIPFTSYQWVQVVYWSLAWEAGFYLAVAVGIGVIATRNRWIADGLVLTFALCISARLVSDLVALFAMGVVVFRARDGAASRCRSLIQVLILAFSVICVGSVVKAVTGTLAAVAILGESFCPTVPKVMNGILCKLGAISFSLYLLHVPIGGKLVNFGQRFASGQIAHFAVSLFALFVSLMAATVFSWAVERHCIVWSRNFRISTARSRT